jgi:mRNA interferase HicA
VKRSALIRHLVSHNCQLKREGSAHSVWENVETGEFDLIPRHNEIPDQIARKICRCLSIPPPPG